MDCLNPGSNTAYVNDGCRCTRCRTLWNERQRLHLAANPDQVAAKNARGRARTAALATLRQRHPEAWERHKTEAPTTWAAKTALRAEFADEYDQLLNGTP